MTTIADIEALGIELPTNILATIEFMSHGNDGAQNTAKELERDLTELLSIILRQQGTIEALAELSAELEAEVAQLEMCGSCRWCGSVEYLNCTHDDVPERERGEFYVSLDDHCHFTPTRWRPRTEEE